MSQLVEANVCENRESHEEDKRRIKQNQACLANVGVIEKHKTGSGDAGGQGVSGLPHNEEDNRNGKRAKGGGHSTVCDIRNVVGDVGIADVLEEELALVTDEPASEGEQKLAERGVDIEEVGSLQVV